MQGSEKYFNAPIELYSGFMVDTDQVLRRVMCYALYEWTEKYADMRFKGTMDFFKVEGNAVMLENIGREVYHKHSPGPPPMTGISTEVYWNFRSEEEKSDLDKATLLAFLALKSIVGTKPYMKINNDLLLSRMDGKRRSVKPEAISKEIQAFSKRYWLDKIKDELVNSWNVTFFSKNMRGFYVSLTLNPEQLAYYAIKNSREKKSAAKTAQDQAYQKALDVINGKLPESALKSSTPVTASVPDELPF
jgi:hypothetical protein